MPTAQPPPSASEQRPPRGSWTRAALGAGGAVENSFQNAPLNLANPIYNVGLGVSPVLIGFAMALPRIWELLLDPLIGSLSDRTKSRWGRRLPYMVPGLAASFLLFVALWWVPSSWSHFSQGIWLIVAALLFYTAYSFFAIPYAALTIEASHAGPDRIGVMTARAAFANFSSILINWLYWLCQRDWFPSPVEGMRWVGLAFGFTIFVAGLVVIVSTLRAGAPSDPAKDSASKGNYLKILRLRSTQRFLFAILATMLGFTLVGHLGFYLVAFYACAGDLKSAALATAVKSSLGMLAGLIACPFIGAAAKRLGKHTVMSLALLLGIISKLSLWFLLIPGNPYLSVIGDIGVSVCLAAFWLLMPAFLGDISDSYQAQTGQSCQGELSALYGIAVKVGASLALLLTGYILLACGFHADMADEAMAAPLSQMRILFSLCPSLGLFLAWRAMRGFRASSGSLD